MTCSNFAPLTRPDRRKGNTKAKNRKRQAWGIYIKKNVATKKTYISHQENILQKEGGKEGGKEVGKEVGKEARKEGTNEETKQGKKEASKQASKEARKEGRKEGMKLKVVSNYIYLI